MPYREKIAWLSMAAMAVTFGPYFAVIATTPHWAAMPILRQLGLFVEVVVAQVIILVAGHIIIAARTPSEARMPPDERDRAISRQAITLAYYVLVCGIIIVGCVMPFTGAGRQVFNAALLAIVLAELVHYGSAALAYRRQA